MHYTHTSPKTHKSTNNSKISQETHTNNTYAHPATLTALSSTNPLINERYDSPVLSLFLPGEGYQYGAVKNILSQALSLNDHQHSMHVVSYTW